MRAFGSRLRELAAAVAVALLCALPVAGQESPATGGPSVAEAPDPRPIAVLPLTNRSPTGAPLRRIHETLLAHLSDGGFNLLDPTLLEEFMRRHRMRYTAGLSRGMAERLRDETGSWAAWITTVDLYDERNPPKIALTSRLVALGERPRIVWMDSVVWVGDQAPGGFDLGLVSDLSVLEERALSGLVASAAGQGPPPKKPRRRFRPAAHYASPEFPMLRDRPARIAVLPFGNDTTTRYAGEIVTDLTIRHLLEAGADVVEPGVVRQVMLEARQLYSEGPSVPETDILRLYLKADVVLFGEVSQYEEKLDPRPTRVEFLVRAVEAESGELIWASSSFAGGNKGVYFWGAGSVHAAQALASEMVRSLVATARRERARVSTER